MRDEHPLDIFMCAWRGAFIVAAYLSAPIMVISYAMMVGRFAQAADWWVTVIVVISHLLGWIGIASLFDRQQERRHPPQDAQSEEHQRF